jgi:hypothetical protein
VDGDGKIFKKELYRGKRCVEKLIDSLEKVSELVTQNLQFYKEMKMTITDEKSFANSKSCHICNKNYKKNDIRVRDHCHVSGNYRGSAHQACNLNFSYDNILPVFFHNLKNYDSHILLHGFKKYKKKLTVVPNNTEKFLSIQADKILFLDSMQFLPSSLETLVSNLRKQGLHKFDLMKEAFGDKFKDLVRKGLYPYEYMDSWEKFDQVNFPKIDEFYSSLRDEHVAKDDYLEAKRLYEDVFKCENLGQWHDIYLQTDTILLACVFEDFRRVAITNYGLDPTYYYSAPGLSWDAALKISKVKLELITDIDTFLFIEKGLRGGISMITQRRSLANNKYMDNFDSSKPSKYILYLDKNNLYGESMGCAKLPVNNFQWLTKNEINQIQVKDYNDDSDVGYFLECDLEYPCEIHDFHSDYPLAPEKMSVNSNDFGEYQKSLMNKLHINYLDHQKKLIPSLNDRKNYVLHIRNLKFYVSKGMKVKKIHRVLSFNQSMWLSEYIMLNTKLRIEAKNDFEKDFFKLMNNSCFGKTMENKRNRIHVKLTNDPELAKKFIAKSNFDSFHRIKGDLFAFSMKQKSVKLDKPCYLGFTVLDLSKLFMYEFHYNNIKSWFGDNAKLLMTDTDSLMYEITTDDVFMDLFPHKSLFDFSDYPATHFLHDTKNKKVIGKMKDEANGDILTDFVGLGPKMYSVIGQSNTKELNKKAAKGVVRSILKHKLNHEHYVNVYERQNRLMLTAKIIRSRKHKLFTIEIKKSGLHAFDSKRFIKNDGVNTLAWGHRCLKKNKKRLKK